MSERSRHSYEFGPFLLDVDKRLLWRNGEPLPLAPKVFETLLALIADRDRMLTKDELLKQVWGDTNVEEGGLTRNVSLLRKALGEKPDDHRYIVTVPARGYRFVANVRETSATPTLQEPAGPAEAGAAQGASMPSGPNSDAVQRRRPGSRRLVLVGLAALAIGGALYAMHVRQAIDPPRRAITSLAVLPLENLSGDPTQDYFADGMTEALIGNLARIRALRVVSRTSVMRWKGTRRTLSEIKNALEVDAVVEGSVQRTGDRIKISLQLVDAPTDTHLWAGEYESERMDVLKLQGEVARAVAEEIRIHVTAEERALMASTSRVAPAAYQEYLVGRYHLWRYDEESLKQAITHFERATQIDPTFAAAYAGISHAWWARGVYGPTGAKAVEVPARAAAQKALALDAALAEAHVVQADIKRLYDWDWTGSETSITRALALDPNDAHAHYTYALLLCQLGRFPEAMAHIDTAARLDPLAPAIQMNFARILYRARRFDEAVRRLDLALELEPGIAGVQTLLGDIYAQMGLHAKALDAYRKTGLGAQDNQWRVVRLYALQGRHDEARQMLAGLSAVKPKNPAVAAAAYAALGDKDDAFALLFAMQGGDAFNYVKVDPPLEGLRSDRRWPTLLRRMNLATDDQTPGAGRD